MKRLLNTFIAVSLFSAFSVPAFSDEGMDLVSTEGAICSERQAGKDIKTKGKEDTQSTEGSSAEEA